MLHMVDLLIGLVTLAHEDDDVVLRPLVMLGLSLIFAAVGFADDWTKIKKKQNQGLTAKQKLLLQIAAAVLFLVVMRVMGYLTAAFYIPFFGVTWRLPWWLYLVISVFIIIGADNAVNLTDGIDGLCSSVTLIVAGFVFTAACISYYQWIEENFGSFFIRDFNPFAADGCCFLFHGLYYTIARLFCTSRAPDVFGLTFPVPSAIMALSGGMIK